MFKLEWNILAQLQAEIYASLSYTCFSRESVATREIVASTQFILYKESNSFLIYKKKEKELC
jgi:hypothetical protein